MQFEGLPERARDFVDPAIWQELQPFDPSNALHIDRVAEGLLATFARDNDAAAFAALIELTAPRLEQIADDIADQQGLAMPPSDLVSTYMSRLFITLDGPRQPPKHFLAEATRRMTEEAECWVRDFALEDLSGADGGKGDGEAAGDGSEAYARIVRTCFHRLDIGLRRILRAADVEGLDTEQIGRRFGLTKEQAAQQIRAARQRLDQAVRAAQAGQGGSA